MSRARIVPGTLSVTALAALAALRRAADASDPATARGPDRPVDRIDFVREARRLAADGATVADIAGALDVPRAEIRALMGPKAK